ncbi:MAG: IS110 family transposase [Desulfobacterales bacterium]|nr:IS110 family transposase [Desulfobacterales bacterium]
MSKTKKKNKKKVTKIKIDEFTIIRPNAAGIDVSSKDYVIAVPSDRDKEPIKTFGCFTCDLYAIAEWLIKCQIDSVAMESTGIYWKQLFLVLQEYGLEVFLVNSRHVKNVTGKKTDEEDARWIQRLHACGLLSNSFQPGEEIRTLRSLVRQRKRVNENKNPSTSRMVKALEEMNIKLKLVLSDIKSVSGQAIIKAIIEGKRNPNDLIKYVHHKVKAKRDDILKALEGNWRDECLFELKQSYDSYNFLQQQTLECDEKIEEQLTKIVAQKKDGDITDLEKTKKKHYRKNEFSFDVNKYLMQIIEIDLTKIYGISEETALTLFSETGSDLSSFRIDDRFTSWCGLAPNNKISGGKIISSHLPKKRHPIKKALLRAANSLYRSENPLGDLYRKKKSQLGPKGAKCVVARKLAVIYFHMMTKKEPFNIEFYQKQQIKNKQNRIKHLEKQIAELKDVA